MDKDFDNWNFLKKNLSKKEADLFFHPREIWFCSIGKNIGYEEDGKNELFERPILILKKFNNDIFLAIPLTNSKKQNKYYYKYKLGQKTYSGIISQIRILDKKRLSRKIGMMLMKDFSEILDLVQELFKNNKNNETPIRGSLGGLSHLR